MGYTTCKQCGDTFWREDNETWKRLCLGCWLERKRQEDGREAELQQEIEQLRASLASARRAAASAGPSLDRRFLKRIVSLTHPDKHGGSEAATEVTQQLLAIMNRQGNRNAW